MARKSLRKVSRKKFSRKKVSRKTMKRRTMKRRTMKHKKVSRRTMKRRGGNPRTPPPRDTPLMFKEEMGKALVAPHPKPLAAAAAATASKVEGYVGSHDPKKMYDHMTSTVGGDPGGQRAKEVYFTHSGFLSKFTKHMLTQLTRGRQPGEVVGFVQKVLDTPDAKGKKWIDAFPREGKAAKAGRFAKKTPVIGSLGKKLVKKTGLFKEELAVPPKFKNLDCLKITLGAREGFTTDTLVIKKIQIFYSAEFWSDDKSLTLYDNKVERLEDSRIVVLMRHCPACHNVTDHIWEKGGLSGFVSNCLEITGWYLSNKKAIANLRDAVFDSKPVEFVPHCSASFRTALTGTLVSCALGKVSDWDVWEGTSKQDGSDPMKTIDTFDLPYRKDEKKADRKRNCNSDDTKSFKLLPKILLDHKKLLGLKGQDEPIWPTIYVFMYIGEHPMVPCGVDRVNCPILPLVATTILNVVFGVNYIPKEEGHPAIENVAAKVGMTGSVEARIWPEIVDVEAATKEAKEAARADEPVTPDAREQPFTPPSSPPKQVMA
jgi:hypothetical protein